MNPSRLHSIEQGLSGVAKKVLDATPIEEAWPAYRIQTEIKRVSGSQIESKTVLGCLSTLVDQGLVKEIGTRQQTFQRAAIRERSAHVKLIKDEPFIAVKPEVTPMAKNDVDLISTAGEIATSLRETAAKVEDFGIACAKQIADKDKESSLLLQLKEFINR